jgi:membrane protein YdbS with pleckstrin-like domain
MLCTTCNTDVPANSSFCPKCGQRMNEPADRPAAPQSQPTQVAGEAPRPIAPTGPDPEAGKVLWSGCYSPKAMVGWWVLEAVIILAAIVAAVLLLVVFPPIWMVSAAVVVISLLWLLGTMLVRQWSLSYELTTEQLIHREGLLKRVTNRIETIDIDDVTHEQTLFERMLGIGSILVMSSDKSHPQLRLRGIDQVQRVADLIDTTAREQRRKRSAYVEQI